ncbi:hypothetical protein BD311DRAFT_665429 [Dichomitus squalens]|uniref:Uncharacterized protein n=1 Tax=Dichomitus squalens TaxID=114155 RepID=A0A4Q9MIU3_9APHY|nr:hypothetical protein BD311DRAFT_665429 [Dichomitus squalens]
MAPQPGVYYGPDEPESTINFERYFIAGDFITGVGFGVQLVLWTTCVTYLWKETKKRGWKTMFLVGYLAILLSVQFIYCIVQARTVQVMYVDNRNYPGGPWQYFLDTQYLAINVIFDATLFIQTFLCDLLVLWRCYVIWTVSGASMAITVVALPTILLVASFVVGTIWTLQSTHPNLSLYSKEPEAFGTAYYAVSLGLNIFLTTLILARLLMHRRTILEHLPPEHAKHYLSLMTLIVESAALYSAFAIMFLVAYGLNQPINQIFLGFSQAAQQVATYLIIYRIANGTAWSREAIESRTLTTIQFDKMTSAGQAKQTDTSTVQLASELVSRVELDHAKGETSE